MQELIQEIAKKADISEDKAKLAAEAAIEFIKKRVAHTLDNKVTQTFKNLTIMVKADVHEAVTGEPAETIVEKLGDFAENTKEKLEDFAEDAKEKLGEFAKTAKNFFGGMMGKKEDKTQKEENTADKKEEDKN